MEKTPPVIKEWFISKLPNDKKEQGGYVDGEDATYQRPSKGHLVDYIKLYKNCI